MLSERNAPLASCAGVPALIKPWQPHVECRSCVRRTHIGTSVIAPAMKRAAGGWHCANKVVA